MHAPRFCQYCGAERGPQARYCVQCGAPLEAAPSGSGKAGRLPRMSPQLAPLFVAGVVVVSIGAAVVSGLLFPAPRTTLSNKPTEAAPLPQDHPPIRIPEEVKKAIAELLDKAKAEPDNLDLWRQVAQAQYRAGLLEPEYLDGAETAYQHILAKAPEDLDALRALGNIAYERQKPAVAISFYQRYLAVKPEDPEVRTDYGTMLLASGKQEEAVQTYRSVIDKNPDFFQAHFNLGVAYHGMGKVEEALAAFRKARDLAPDQRIREQVDQVLARVQGAPQPEQVQTGTGRSENESGTFRAAAESLFRQNPVMGSRVQRIDWQGEFAARVYLKDFPMEQMGDSMRALFRERMIGRLREQKSRFKVSETVRFELVDAQSGRVMDTLTDPPSGS